MTSDCIVLEQEVSDMKCSIRCPQCGKNSALCRYYTQAGVGVGFRIRNFIRHIETFHKNSPERTPLAEIEVNRLKSSLNAEKEKNESLLKENSMLQKRGLINPIAMYAKRARREENKSRNDSDSRFLELYQKQEHLEQENQRKKLEC